MRFELGRARSGVAGRGHADATRSASPATTSRRPCTTCSSPSTPSSARAPRRPDPARLVDRPPRVQGLGRAQRRRSAPSSPATSPTDAGGDPGPAARPRPAAPAPAAHRRRRLRPPRARAGRARAGGGRALVPTGLAVAIPSGYAGFVLPRSGLALKSRHHVPEHARAHRLRSTAASSRCCWSTPTRASRYTVERGDRIAQLVIQRVEQVDWREVERLDSTERDTFGFGSTGV